jgi:tripartite-type tricarboxylate transporter receptor subunit TctC
LESPPRAHTRSRKHWPGASSARYWPSQHLGNNENREEHMKPASLRMLLALVATEVLVLAGALPASAYPTKPIRIVVPFTPGSATDIIARIVQPRMAEHWGIPIVMDNRPSAGGIVACTIVAEAAPDGHTLLVTGSNFAGSAALYSKLPFDAVRDFAGVSQYASTPLVLVVSPALGVKSVKELIALAHAKPGQLNFGSTGLGSGTHYGAVLFNLAAKIDAVHVPYRGSPESLTDLMAGRVQYIASPVLAAVPLIRNKRLLALGVTTPYRAKALPDVATIAESGLPGFVYEGWYGMLAPGKTPRGIIDQLSAEVRRIIALPAVMESISNQGAIPKSSTAREFDSVVHNEIAKRKSVWKAAGVKVD